MSADRAETAAEPASDEGAVSGVHPIFDAISKLARVVTNEKLQHLFDQADDIIFEMLEHAANNKERRTFLDAMLILRRERIGIISGCLKGLSSAFTAAELTDRVGEAADPDSSQMSLISTEDLDERLAVSTMEQRASARFSTEIFDVERRLSHLSRVSGTELPINAFQPARIVRSFRQSVRGLQVDLPIKLVIYKLFDRVVLSEVGEFYRGASDILEKEGIKFFRTSPDSDSSQRVGARQAVGAAGFDGAIHQPQSGKADTLQQEPLFSDAVHSESARNGLIDALIRAFGAQPAQRQITAKQSRSHKAPGYASSMAQLECEGTLGGCNLPSHEQRFIAELINNLAESGQRNGKNPLGPGSHLAAVGSLFEGLYNESPLPDDLWRMFARLQVPAVKQAIVNPNFILDRLHPMRRALYDLHFLMGLAGAPGGPSRAELEGMVDELAAACDLDADSVRSAAVNPAVRFAVPDFFGEFTDLTGDRRRVRSTRIRHLVIHEIRLRLHTHEHPADVMRLFISGFGALLTLDYLSHGKGAAPWNATIQLLDQIVESIGDGSGSQEDGASETRQVLLKCVSDRLLEAGISQPRVEELTRGLSRAYREIEESGFTPTNSANVDSDAQRESRRGAMPESVWDASNETIDEPKAAATAVSTSKFGQESPSPKSAGRLLDRDRSLLFNILSGLLSPGSIFRVYHLGSDSYHFLRLRQFYPRQDRVAFETFVADRVLHLSALQFASDLVAQRSCPSDIDPSVVDAILLLQTFDLTNVQASPPLWAEP